jgi:SAM-dependent methyltransferase
MAKGITRIDDLAAASGSHSDSLRRVLRHLVGKGLFEEPAPGRFALNEPARGLMDSSTRLGLDLSGFGGRMAYAWGSLLNAVRTGGPAYHEVFGRPFWDDLAAHPDVAASFDDLMGPAGHGTPDTEVLLAGDWESVHTVVDVGGGTGALLAGILRARPEVRGILVDFPGTVARSAQTFAAAGVAERVTTVGQSFFDPLPAGADLYLLKSVLHDWPDREATAILKRCAEAARPTGRVVVISGASPDEDGEPSPALLMMVLVGGKDRTLSQFRQLASAAGLDVKATGRLPSGRFAVECRAIA